MLHLLGWPTAKDIALKVIAAKDFSDISCYDLRETLFSELNSQMVDFE